VAAQKPCSPSHHDSTCQMSPDVPRCPVLACVSSEYELSLSTI
jgi:hypothetical protein